MLVRHVSPTQQRRKFRHQPLVNGHPLRREKLLLCGLGKLHRRCHPEVVMVLVLTGRRCVIVMMFTVLRRVEMRAETLTPMLQRNVRAGTEPGEQHQRRDELAG